MKMCWNWKVLAGLAAVGAGIFLLAPGLALAAAPFLLMAACPLSMVLMMRGMGGMQHGQDQPVAATAVATPTREERLAQLQAQLAGVQAEQAALAREIQLEQERTAAGPTTSGRRLNETERLASEAAVG